MSILLELAKQYPGKRCYILWRREWGITLGCRSRSRRDGTGCKASKACGHAAKNKRTGMFTGCYLMCSLIVRIKVLILACVLLQSGLEGNCDVVREIMKTAATQAERVMALLHVGQIVTKYGTLASPFFKLLFKLFSRCRDSGEQALFAHGMHFLFHPCAQHQPMLTINLFCADQHNLFRSWDHAFVAKRVTKAMEASPERWHLELFFCCVRGAADLNVPEWEALFHDSKQYLFHSLTLEHLQQPAVAGIVYWTRRAEYSKAMLTDPLLTHTLMSVFEVGATTDDKAAHPGGKYKLTSFSNAPHIRIVYAFFEQLLTNETAQVCSRISIYMYPDIMTL